MIKNNSLFNTLLIVLILVNSILVSCLFYNLGKRETNLKQIDASFSDSGKIQVKVLEANTLEPIDGATVCIIETRHYETTNKYGMTNLIEVPIIRNSNYDLSLPRKWGEISLLVYKSGYADNLSLNVSVSAGSTRVGIIVYLSPIINAEDNKPTISVEYPNKSWAENLIKLYKKRV